MRHPATALTASLVLAVGCGEGISGPGPQAGSTPLRTATPAAHAQSKNFVAPLSGDEEVPPAATHAAGNATFHLDRDGTELRYRLIVAHIEDVLASHIHCGAAGVNGPVVAFLFLGEPGGGRTNGPLAEGTVTPADVVARPDSPECPGGVADFDDLVERMRSGGAYVNVHTLAFPGGEIRGQVRAAGPSRR